MSGRIPQSFIQDIISRVDLVDLIKPRINLKKRGNNFVARCPFHEEKTPSFTVSPQKQFYYCFGCGANGNCIGFLMAYERLDFVEAIKYFANQLGLEIPQLGNHDAKATNHQPHYQLLETVTNHYKNALRHSQVAIDYLKSRDISGNIAKRFQLGYATPNWENLEVAMPTSEQHTLLAANGLVLQNKTGKYYDRFRNRIIFPIRDTRGRVIAFGGRSIDNTDPKYMNSPETPIFHKGNELYGLYEALQMNRQLPRALIVEGYMDVVSLHQHGVTCAVATLGTATSSRHLQKLLRHTHEVIYCFDGDEAGRKAAWRALTTSLPLLNDETHLRFLFLPQKEDPDSLIKKIGKSDFEKMITSALPLSDVFFNEIQRTTPIRSVDDKAHFAKKAMQYLETMPHGLYRELLQQQLQQRIGASLDLNRPLQRPVVMRKMPRKTTRIIPPALQAITAILQQPSIALDILQFEALHSFDFEAKELLLKVIEFIQIHPHINTVGALFASWPEDCPDRDTLIEMAKRDLPVEGVSALRAELNGALLRIQEQHHNQIADYLINKAKTEELSCVEKKRLQNLLTKRQSDII